MKLDRNSPTSRSAAARHGGDVEGAPDVVAAEERDERDAGYEAHAAGGPLRDDSLVAAKQQLADAVEGLVDVLSQPDVMRAIGDVDRQNLAKYLTIAKLKLENTIALVRRG